MPISIPGKMVFTLKWGQGQFPRKYPQWTHTPQLTLEITTNFHIVCVWDECPFDKSCHKHQLTCCICMFYWLCDRRHGRYHEGFCRASISWYIYTPMGHNIPNCMNEVTRLSYSLSTNGHRSAALGWLPFILPPVFVQAAVLSSW